MSASSVREIGELADLVADVDAKVPQRVEETVQKPLIGRTDLTVEQNQQVDVREQTQLPPTVAAERDRGDGLRRRGRASNS